MTMRICWCGNKKFLPFNTQYGKCQVCGTLVYLKDTPPEQFLVKNDETDYYGKKYWLEHQQDDFGYADIHTRSRNDLTDRNLHWLKTLLKYCLPPAKVLELGCSHGSFVALMGQAGYDASGLEMSPWVVEFGQKTFGISVVVGPIEDLDIALGSLDVIVLMDVLEHLPDPVATMSNCLKVLKKDGLILIQTPKVKDGINYSELVETKDRFQEMLIPEEHLYLFSENSVTQLFNQLGAEYIQFEPAIFAHYDMFFVVSRAPMVVNETEAVESALLATPNGRIALALMDLREREIDLVLKVQESEKDRSSRGEQIDILSKQLKEAEVDRSSRGEQIDILSKQLKEAEIDRSSRGEQIDILSKQLKEAEIDRSSRGEQIDILSKLLKEAEVDRSSRGEQIDILSKQLKEAEIDRSSRREQIDILSKQLKEAEIDRSSRGEQIESLSFMLKESESDRTARWAQIETLTSLVNVAHTDSLKLIDKIRTMNALNQELNLDCAAKNIEFELLMTDLRTMFSRRGFNMMTRISDWPEVKELTKWIEKPNE